MNNTQKQFIIRIDKDLWKFLKQHSVEKEVSMNVIVCKLIKKLHDKKTKKVDTK